MSEGCFDLLSNFYIRATVEMVSEEPLAPDCRKDRPELSKNLAGRVAHATPAGHRPRRRRDDRRRLLLGRMGARQHREDACREASGIRAGRDTCSTLRPEV